jgi:hypothetical protein
VLAVYCKAEVACIAEQQLWVKGGNRSPFFMVSMGWLRMMAQQRVAAFTSSSFMPEATQIPCHVLYSTSISSTVTKISMPTCQQR